MKSRLWTELDVSHVKSPVSTYILKTTGCHDNSPWQHVYRVYLYSLIVSSLNLYLTQACNITVSASYCEYVVHINKLCPQACTPTLMNTTRHHDAQHCIYIFVNNVIKPCLCVSHYTKHEQPNQLNIQSYYVSRVSKTALPLTTTHNTCIDSLRFTHNSLSLQTTHTHFTVTVRSFHRHLPWFDIKLMIFSSPLVTRAWH